MFIAAAVILAGAIGYFCGHFLGWGGMAISAPLAVLLGGLGAWLQFTARRFY